MDHDSWQSFLSRFTKSGFTFFLLSNFLFRMRTDWLRTLLFKLKELTSMKSPLGSYLIGNCIWKQNNHENNITICVVSSWKIYLEKWSCLTVTRLVAQIYLDHEKRVKGKIHMIFLWLLSDVGSALSIVFKPTADVSCVSTIAQWLMVKLELTM